MIIHDPIHGTIEVSVPEIRVIDSKPMQRLRHIRQLGFAEFAFPGATHSRYAHSLGAMQMATRMIDRALHDRELPASDKERLAQMVRLAVLFHDIGHAPFSHVSERVMPNVQALKLGGWTEGEDRQATHEDYTVKLLVDSELTELVAQHFGDLGITGALLAGLVVGREPPDQPHAFRVGGKNYLPLLHQIVSSELDGDRMDYLRRDSYFAGVSYGNFDHVWLTNNITATDWEDSVTMGLHHKGVWAFENFLLARYHMFLSVYYHHTSICFEHMLGRFYDSGVYALSGDSEAYLQTDDVQLTNVLRQSNDPWAQRIVARKGYRLLLETHEFGSDSQYDQMPDKLRESNIEYFSVKSKGVLSKYFRRRDRMFPLLVLEPERGRVQRIEDYTPLYRRFDEVVAVSRIYCLPEQLGAARKLLA